MTDDQYVYITKYALTQGVYRCKLIDMRGTNMVVVEWPGGAMGKAYFHGNDWHRTKERAEQRVYTMIKMRTNSLRASLKKLEGFQLEWKEK